MDGLVREGSGNKLNQPSKTDASKLPSNIIGAIKTFFCFFLLAIQFFLLPLAPPQNPQSHQT